MFLARDSYRFSNVLITSLSLSLSRPKKWWEQLFSPSLQSLFLSHVSTVLQVPPPQTPLCLEAAHSKSMHPTRPTSRISTHSSPPWSTRPPTPPTTTTPSWAQALKTSSTDSTNAAVTWPCPTAPRVLLVP